jgi:membrane protein DedA with SNARE-associated domain
VSGIFEWLYQTVQAIMQVLGYPGIFILMLVENLFPPIPSELVMPFAGFMAARGELNLIGVLIAGTLGSLAGAVLIYMIGMKLGQDRLRGWVCKWGKYLLVADQDLNRALETFDRHGNQAVFIGRLIPGVRSLISLPAGLRRMDMKVFLALTLLGTVLWNSILTTAGYILGSNWEAVLEFLETYELVIQIAFGAVLLYFLARRIRHRPVNTGC